MPAVLAPNVLDGVQVCLAFGDGPVGERLTALGAAVTAWPVPAGASEETDAAASAAAAALTGRPDVVVVDAAAVQGTAAADAVAALRAAVDSAFVVVRAIAHTRWIEPGEPGGKVVLIAPAPSEHPHGAACAAALENAARTLSVEWARFGIRVVAIAPRDGADPADVAELVAFLASPGGDYYSGCTLRPGEPPA